jgi:hypothetical protein
MSPRPVPQQGPYGERCFVSRASGLFIHLDPSESPIRSPRMKNRKCTVTVHGALCGQKAYIKWGAAWFPKGIVNDTPVTALVPCILQHDTFHLGLGRPEPR